MSCLLSVPDMVSLSNDETVPCFGCLAVPSGRGAKAATSVRGGSKSPAHIYIYIYIHIYIYICIDICMYVCVYRSSEMVFAYTSIWKRYTKTDVC